MRGSLILDENDLATVGAACEIALNFLSREPQLSLNETELAHQVAAVTLDFAAQGETNTIRLANLTIAYMRNELRSASL